MLVCLPRRANVRTVTMTTTASVLIRPPLSSWVSGFSTSSSAVEEKTDKNKFHPVYVHHVSKTVLQHLQENQSQWLLRQGLDKGLKINSNGTFVMQFPSKKGQLDGGRIWTSYDTASKQHWLNVYRQKLLGRFLLKDTSMRKVAAIGTTEEGIRQGVDQMITTLSEMEAKRAGAR